MSNKKIFNPNYKTGVKILTKEQMQAGLPSYDLLLTKIDKVREEALIIDRETLTSHTFENLKYDNIFSILGGRGAGKTSVLMTLHHELQKDENNVILPLVMPELLDEEESIVGWLLSAIEYNLIQIEEQISKHGIKDVSNSYKQFCTNYKLFERCVFSKNNKLRECFHQLKTAYYTKEYKSCKMTAMDYSSIKELIASGVDNSFSLIGKFTDYWNTLVDVYTEYLKDMLGLESSNDIKTTPLIHIFIDDADLKPQIINELLFVIPKYLSHPNVVVYVSASQKTLTYAVKNHMYKSLTQTAFNLPDIMEREYQYNNDRFANGNETTVKFHDLRYGKEYAKITKLADEVLRKTFPVYKRFYLKKYNNYSEKRLLRVFKDETPDCIETMQLSEKIAEMLGEFRDKILELHGEPKKEPAEPTQLTLDKKIESFKLVKYNKVNGHFQLGSEMYLSFLAQYPRDTMSVVCSLRDMLKNMVQLLEKYYKENNISQGAMPLEFIDNMHEIIIKFISATVASNRNLSMFSRPIRDFVKTQLLHWQLYVDYAKVLEIFNDERYVNGNKKECSSFVEMFCLLNFVEQLIILVMPQRRSVHGEKEFNALLRDCEIEVVKPVSDIDLLFKQYYLFESMHLIPNYNFRREGQANSFLKGVVSLELDKFFSNRNDIKKYRNWYELVVQTWFWNQSLAAQVEIKKDELIILKPSVFLDHIYNDLRMNYLEHLERNYYYEIKPESLKRNTKEILLSMDKAIDALDDAISNLYLIYSENHQDSLNKIIDILPDNTLLKQRVENFILKISSEEYILRSDFLDELQSIEIIVDNIMRNRIDFKKWLQVFQDVLSHNMILDDSDDSYSEYVEACEAIGNLYKEYIDCYTWINRNEYENVTKFNIFTSGTSSMMNSIIDKIKWREWFKIVGTE